MLLELLYSLLMLLNRLSVALLQSLDLREHVEPALLPEPVVLEQLDHHLGDDPNCVPGASLNRAPALVNPALRELRLDLRLRGFLPRVDLAPHDVGDAGHVVEQGLQAFAPFVERGDGLRDLPRSASTESRC